ncbi:hypothetical protein [Agromyces humi]|uniref:hypothetical protein n=1 Tax=Agromyces humi TaxID=1766800 RepID=UPI0013587EA2|nr:hypothetical protein [Agromyces humi]
MSTINPTHTRTRPLHHQGGSSTRYQVSRPLDNGWRERTVPIAEIHRIARENRRRRRQTRVIYPALFGALASMTMAAIYLMASAPI